MKSWEELIKHSMILQSRVNELTQNHNSLQSFKDAIGWDNGAEAVIRLFQDYQNNLNEYREESIEVLERMKQERNKSPFMQKIFSSRTSEKECNENIRKSDSGIQSIEKGIEILHAMMDKTPGSKTEQKAIVDELRQLKKDLTLQKREINENMRQTRVTARQKTIQYTGINSGILGGVARYQRVSARLEKERALIPGEDQKKFIEKKLIAIERDLNWVLNFKTEVSDEKAQFPQTNMVINEVKQKCSYCGRTLNAEDYCPSCGAVNP
jgi:hypothetical protein